MVTKLHCQQNWGTHNENERHIVSEVRVMDVFRMQNRACLPLLSKRIYIYLLNSSQHRFFTPPLQLPSIFTPALCLHPRTSPVLFTTRRQGVFQKSGTAACLHSASALFWICSPSPLLLLSSSHFSQRSSHCLLFNSATSMNKDVDIRKVLKAVPHKWMRSCTVNRWCYKLVSGHI